MSGKEEIIKILLNVIKTMINTSKSRLSDYSVDHDTPNYNIKIEITER